jgi:hypothetical protein
MVPPAAAIAIRISFFMMQSYVSPGRWRQSVLAFPAAFRAAVRRSDGLVHRSLPVTP